MRRFTIMSANRPLEPLSSFGSTSHSVAADDLWLPANQQLAWCVVAATGLTALVVWPTAQWFMSTITKIAWLYVVTGTRG